MRLPTILRQQKYVLRLQEVRIVLREPLSVRIHSCAFAEHRIAGGDHLPGGGGAHPSGGASLAPMDCHASEGLRSGVVEGRRRLGNGRARQEGALQRVKALEAFDVAGAQRIYRSARKKVIRNGDEGFLLEAVEYKLLESLVLTVLERVLGQCARGRAIRTRPWRWLSRHCLCRARSCPDVEGLDRASLKVAVWSGNVTLTDLKLRREACYA